MSNNDNHITIEGLDLGEIISFLQSKNKRYLAMTLQDIEETVGKSHPGYPIMRKAVLDGFNNYTRSLIRYLFGVDIEEKGYDR